MAVGCIGMSVPDYEHATPGEFTAILAQWREHNERREQAEWERMRLLATMVMQPHCKGRLKPEKILPLPWDHKAPPPREDKPVSRAARRERMEQLANRSLHKDE